MYIAISFFGLSASRNRSWATTRVDIIPRRTSDEDDALLQQTREDVVGALAPVGLLDHHGDEGIHVGIKGVAHGSTCLRSAAWDRRRESAMLLQNRNAFGHAFIKDI